MEKNKQEVKESDKGRPPSWWEIEGAVIPRKDDSVGSLSGFLNLFRALEK